MAVYDLGTARGRIDIDSSGATKGVAEAEKGVVSFSNRANQVSSTLIKSGAAIGSIGIAAVAGFGLAIHSAADFEKGVSAVGAVSGATTQQLEQVRQKALQIGKDTKFSAGEAVGAIEELVKAGVSIDDVMNGAADATANLAAAGEVSIPEAATIAANAMNGFALSAKEMPHIADLISGAANASAIDVAEFGQAMQQSAAVAHVSGLSFDDLAVAIAAMGNAGIKGSDAGTSLKTFIQNLIPQTQQQTDLMKKLGIVTADGANQFFDATGKIKSMADIGQVLQNSLKGMTKEQQLATLQTIFGSDAVRSAAVIAENGAQGFNDLAANMGKVSAADVAKKRMDNLSGSLEQLKGSLETALIQTGTPIQKMLKGIVDGITGLVNKFLELSPSTQKWITIAIAAVGALSLLTGGFVAAVGIGVKIINAFVEFKKALNFIKELQLLQRGFALLNATLLANPIILIIAAVIALGIAFFVLYKKSKTFRDIVDTIGRALRTAFTAVVEFVKGAIEFVKKNWDLLLPILLGPIGIAIIIWRRFGDDIKAAISAVINWVKSNWDIILTILTGPVGAIILIWRRFGSTIVSAIGSAIDAVVSFFVGLPGRTVSAIASLLSAFGSFLGKLPGMLGYAIGFMIGTWIRFWVDLVTNTIQGGVQIITAVVGWLTSLPGIIWGFLVSAFQAWVNFQVMLVNGAIQLGTDVINAVVTFFTQLPGVLWGFLVATFNNMVNFVVMMVNKAQEVGSKVIAAIINFFSQLPGKVAGFLGDVISSVLNWVNDMEGKSVDAAAKFFNGLVNGIKNLPGEVAGILGKIIDAIKQKITEAFNAVKDFASSMWEGFKKGLFGSPHTKIEYAMWDMTSNVGKSIDQLRGQVRSVQAIAKTMPDINQTVTVARGAGVLAPSAVPTIVNVPDTGSLEGAEVTVPVTLKIGEDEITTVVAKGFINRKRGRG